METVNNTTMEKLSGLLYSLSVTKEEFEIVADEIEDTNLKTALNGLSLESNQYANELCLQLKKFGISFPKPSLNELNGSNSMSFDEVDHAPGNELMYICRRNENYLLTAYRNMLNEYLPMPVLRDIMLYQLDALKCAFMKINLLNTARFSV